MRYVGFLLLLLLIPAFSAVTGLEKVEPATIALAACNNPYRKHDGVLYNLSPLFNWYKRSTGALRPLREWKCYLGMMVQDLGTNGVLVRLNPDFMDDIQSPLVRIRNYPAQRILVDGNPVACFAIEDGRYQYVNTGGAVQTITSLDYGTIDPEGVKAFATVRDEERSNLLQRIEATKREQQSRKGAADLRLLEYQKQQATNGNPTFQYELAMRYLSGNGVAVNTNEALRWFRQAAQRGYKPAVEKLKAFP